MRYKSSLLVVSDMEKSKRFYKDVLGLDVILDFGENVTLTGGISLQTLDTWKEFIHADNIIFESKNGEIYFEEDNFDDFVGELKKYDIKYVHNIKEHRWGQRVVRFYDPDNHIIEVGENMKVVCNRFVNTGMTLEQTAKRMGVTIKYIEDVIK